MSRTGFILAEDEAVKNNFAGITVTDDRNATRAVGVHFRWPNQEIEKAYPFIVIDLIGIDHAGERQHSDQWVYGFSGTPNAGQQAWLDSHHSSTIKYMPDTGSINTIAAATPGWVRTVEFIPVNLTYQVATYCRNPLHDRQLIAQLFSTGKIPYRYGYIEVPADNSIRRFDLLGWTPADLYDQESAQRKSIFRKIFTLQTTAELSPFQLTSLNTVSSVKITDVVIPVTYFE